MTATNAPKRETIFLQSVFTLVFQPEYHVLLYQHSHRFTADSSKFFDPEDLITDTFATVPSSLTRYFTPTFPSISFLRSKIG